MGDKAPRAHKVRTFLERKDIVFSAKRYLVDAMGSMALGLGAWQGYVCPVMDARRSQVYNALFHVDCGEYTRIREDRAISLAELG